MKPKKEKLCLVYITCGSIKEAKYIGQILLKEKLVACVNILSKIISIFKWEGELEEANEVLMIAKTRKTLINSLIKTVKITHLLRKNRNC